MKYFLTSLVILLCFTSCEDKDDNPIIDAICDTTNSEFRQIYMNFIAVPTSVDEVTMDTETHEYTFFVTAPKTICSIGYQSAHTDPTVPYTIEIINNATATIVYSGSHLFSTTSTTYITPTTTITLQANVSYTIRRTQTNWGSDIINTIGRVSTSYDSTTGSYVDLLPMTVGDLTITSSGFDATGFNQVFYMLPFIDIVFEN